MFHSSALFFSFLVCLHATAQNVLDVKKSDNSIIIDGIIGKAEWNHADSVYGFTQLQPEKGKSSTRNTIVQVTQNGDDIYFLFICHNLPGNQIAARIQRRDLLDESDDIVSILLDTYNDKRTSLLFRVNAIGTLTDAKVTDDGKSIDLLWDTQWEARAAMYENYWVAEIRIPFKAIQFNPSSEIWGANFGRVIRANQETTWWSPVTENFRVSQSGILTGIERIDKKKHRLQLFPYATGRYENSEITGVYKKVKGDAGLDMLYQYGSNVILNATVNPDFATVEGDREQINLTPWELRFPDKRLFFQDGNEMFGTRISTFYSRRIGDVKFGGKLTGKAGKYQFNALSSRTNEDLEMGLSPAWFNAIRIKRDILKSSILGATYTDKIIDTATVRTFSLDYVLNLGKTWKLTGQWVGSTPGDFLSHSGWFVRFARENNIYHYHVRYTNLGKNFQDNVNQTGFVVDDDRHEVDSDVNYTFWFNKRIKYFLLSGKNNVFWSQEGNLRSWYLTYNSRIYSEKGVSFDLSYNNEYKLLDKDYYNHFYRIELGYNTDEATYASAAYQVGRNFDRDFDLLVVESRVQLFKKLSLNYEMNYLTYHPDPTDESTFINVLGADFFFTKDLWIRIFTQNNSSSDRFYFYGLFGWRFKPPFGAIFFIVNTDRFTDLMISDSPYRSQIVFLKMTYPLTIF